MAAGSMPRAACGCRSRCVTKSATPTRTYSIRPPPTRIAVCRSAPPRRGSWQTVRGARHLTPRPPGRIRLLPRLIAHRNQSMWPKNALTERLNLRWPILQAPMGSASTPSLAAAVTNAGGLGGLGMWGRTAEQAARRIAGFRQQSGGSLNVNYPIWPDPRCAPELAEAMRRHLQPQYDAHGLGTVPQPQGMVSDVGPEHVELLLET